MAYRVIVELKGDVSEPVFGTGDAGKSCIAIYDKYVADNSITDYTIENIDSNTRKETIDFTTEAKWDSYLAEMQTVGSSIGPYTTTIVSKTEV